MVNWDCHLQTAISDDEIVRDTVPGSFWHLRYPIIDPAPGEPDGLAAWANHLPELLSDSGYNTALFGKWHLGMNINKLPNTQGYDQFWGHSEGTNAASYTSTPQFDPTVATVPYIWEGIKGEKATKVKPFDLKARAIIDREIT